jgi:hypothetical protein
MALALVGGLAVGLLLLRSDSAPDLTQEALNEARSRWSENGPTSYVLEIQMAGTLSDLRSIVVEDGAVVEMTSNGQPAVESAREHWSVDGLFGFLQQEIDNRASPPAALGVSAPEQIVIKARFDPDLGYPTYFLRHLLGRQVGTEWKVVAFRARDE